MALESCILAPNKFISGSKSWSFLCCNRQTKFPVKVLLQNNRYPFRFGPNCIGSGDVKRFLAPRFEGVDLLVNRARLKALGEDSESSGSTNAVSGSGSKFDFVKELVKCGVLIYGCRRAFALEGVVNAGYGVIGQSILLLRNAWPKTLQVLQVFKEQGLILAALLGLSVFFSMAETSITTLWPWKVRELVEKESEDGVFKLLRNDVTRFLTTILIGTTVVNIGATALVTDAATAIFGEAGVTAATGVMTVAILLLTEITPKSVAVHNPTEVARFVVRPVAWLSLVLYPVGRIVTYLSMGMLKILGLKGRRNVNYLPANCARLISLLHQLKSLFLY